MIAHICVGGFYEGVISYAIKVPSVAESSYR